jgi:hypothetical protein
MVQCNGGDLMDIVTIFSTILFIGPGFLIQFIEDYLYPNSNRFDNNERHIVKAFIDSFFIIIINLIILKNFFRYNFIDFNYFVSKFEIINFFITYVLITFVTCVIYACFIKRCIICLRIYIVNMFNDSTDNKITETKFPTIWDSIFNNSINDFYGKVITIEKEGNQISCGYIGEFPKINAETKELKLVTTKEIQNCMDSEEFRINYIDTIEFEYFDFETGTLIKCYKLINDAFTEFVNREAEEVLQTNE